MARATPNVVDSSAWLALKLPLVDSIVYATAELTSGHVWTQNEHFAKLPNVRFVKKSVRRR